MHYKQVDIIKIYAFSLAHCQFNAGPQTLFSAELCAKNDTADPNSATHFELIQTSY